LIDGLEAVDCVQCDAKLTIHTTLQSSSSSSAVAAAAAYRVSVEPQYAAFT